MIRHELDHVPAIPAADSAAHDDGPEHENMRAPCSDRLLSERLVRDGLSIAVAESLTGGLLASRLARLERASEFFRGGIVAYQPRVKFDLLDVTPGPVVSQRAADEMADGAKRLFASDLALAVTGVGGPGANEGKPPGTVFVSLIAGERRLQLALELCGEPAEICGATCDECFRLLMVALGESDGS